MPEIVIYKAKDGHIELDVSLTDETVWLSLNQMASLFVRDKSVISRHLGNIFKNNELDKDQTVANFATVQKEGKKEVEREIDYFNLDAIISVGYRVNSKEGIRFRQWATSVLKEHIIRGYSLHEKRIAERGIKELQQSIELLQTTLTRNELVNDIGAETIQLIMSYAKTWHLLLAYDEDKLKLPEKGKSAISVLEYDSAKQAITALKIDLAATEELNNRPRKDLGYLTSHEAFELFT